MFRPLPLFIGLRYTRAKRRNHFISFISLISMLGIMLGIVALIVVLSVMNGFHKEIQERILGMASHATLADPNGAMAEWRDLLPRVRQHPAVVGAAPFIEMQVMLANGAEVSGALIRGIEPVEEDQVSELRQDMMRGEVDSLAAGSFNIVLGRELAAVLGLGLGDKVTVVTPQVSATPIGVMPRLKSFTVSGIFSVGMSDYDRGAGFIHLQDAAKLMSLGESVTGLRLKLTNMFEAPLLARQIAYDLGGLYRVVDWTQHHKNFFAALSTEKRMMSIILFLIVAVAAFNIVSTMVMAVKDKRRDIAILRTLGASPRSVLAIFIVQGTLIGLIGILAGALLGVLLAMNLQQLVHGLESLLGVKFLDAKVYFMSDLPAHVRLSDLLRICGVAFGLALLSTLYPAWAAARLPPAQSLRND